MPMRFPLVAAAAAAVAFGVSPLRARQAVAPPAQTGVEGLLAADRDFAARAAGVDAVVALTAMFDAHVLLPMPGGKFARGRDAATAFIRGNAENAASTAAWQPVRGGISADGMQGFTFGFLTVTRASGATAPMKYLSYWIRRPDGWRVLAYRRVARPEGEVSRAMRAPALPGHAAKPRTDIDKRATLMAAETAFSDEAQQIGLGAAFARNGRADAMNMGSAADFTIGATAIGKSLDESGTTSPVRWASDDAIVASSGDLGISWGRIFSNAEPDRAPAAFFTVWRRDGTASPWRYIAE